MRKIVLITAIFIADIFLAQTQILPLDTKGKRIEGAYYKDLNNDLTPYIGTWEGQVDGKTFKVTFEKVKDYSLSYWKDRLYGRYEMRDSKGNLIYKYDFTTEDSKLFSLGFIKNKSIIKLGFLDRCIEGDIYLKFTDSTNSKLEWRYVSIPVLIDSRREKNCVKFNEMPQDTFILTKQ